MFENLTPPYDKKINNLRNLTQVKVGGISTKSKTNLRYSRMTLTNQNCIHREIKPIKLGKFQPQIGPKFYAF